ncbi:MAG: pentapeptide repeat-containing protein [Pseudomonadota bacterium]
MVTWLNRLWVRALEGLRQYYLWGAIPVGGVVYLWIFWIITRDLPGLADQGLSRLAAIMADGDAEEIRNIAYAVGALLGALAILATIPFQLIKTWMNERAALTAEAGQITDRINKAVAQLGAEKTVKDATGERTVPNLEVRLGGIYALERIAQDSLRDHIQVMEILTAYIRHNAPARDPSLPDHEARHSHKTMKKEPPRIDIQASISVIGRRGDRQINKEHAESYRLDLKGCNLRLANMSGVKFNLSHALLSHSFLDSTDLDGAQMMGCDLSHCYMHGTMLNGTRLDKADLYKAELHGAKFSAVRLDRANLRNADFTEAEGLSYEAIASAFGDTGTGMPEGLQRPDHWVKRLRFPRSNQPDAEYQTWLASLPASKDKPDGS